MCKLLSQQTVSGLIASFKIDFTTIEWVKGMLSNSTPSIPKNQSHWGRYFTQSRGIPFKLLEDIPARFFI